MIDDEWGECVYVDGVGGVGERRGASAEREYCVGRCDVYLCVILL